MTPDLRTLSAMLAASALLMSVVLCVGIRTRRADGFTKWNAGLGLLAAGWLLSTLRGWLPDIAAVAAAEALLFTGFCLQLAALREFGQQHPTRGLWLVPGPLLFAVLLVLLRHPAQLTAVASLACAVALAGTAAAAGRLAGGGAPRRMLQLACDAGALILLVRAAGALFLPPARAELFAALESAALVGLFAASAAASIGFLLLHRERAEAGLQRLAAYDPLTEVLNRLAFMNLAEGQMARARRSGEPCALLMLDLDDFKRVNGRLRREAGDRVLRELGALLRGGLRAGDLVGRYGGEEFCVLLPNTTLEGALEVAERMRAAVAARRLGAVAPAVTASIGAAACEPQAAGALHVAIATAERALARAKRDGCNRVAPPALPRRTRRAA